MTAGLLDSETGSDEVVLAAQPGFRQKEIVRQFTKMCWEVREPDVLPLMIRRAFKTAKSDPSGPVNLAMRDMALESKTTRAQVLPAQRFLLQGRARPTKAAVEKTAGMLVKSRRPLLVIGDDVWKAGAQPELLALSEQLELQVADQVTAQAEMVAKGLAMDSPFRAFHNFPVCHPHYLGNFRADSEWMNRGVDLVVCIGCRDFGDRAEMQTHDVPVGARVVRIETKTAAMGRNYPTDMALVGDIKESLAELLEAAAELLPLERWEKIARERSREISAFTAQIRESARRAVQNNFGQSPIHPDELSQVLAESLDADGVMVCENTKASYRPFAFGFRDEEHDVYWHSRGQSAMGCRCSNGSEARSAGPSGRVLYRRRSGDVQRLGFLDQARYNIPVLTVVANNRNYQTLRLVYHGYRGRMAARGHYAGTFLDEPDIDFVALAKSQDVRGEKVDHPRQPRPALERGKAVTREGKPYLIEVATARWGPGAESVWYKSMRSP